MRGIRTDLHVGKHAILAPDGEDDLPVTLPSTSGQVRALYEEEGKNISLVDSIRATHVDSSSDRERVHTNHIPSEIANMLCLKLSWQMNHHLFRTR